MAPGVSVRGPEWTLDRSMLDTSLTLDHGTETRSPVTHQRFESETEMHVVAGLFPGHCTLSLHWGRHGQLITTVRFFSVSVPDNLFSQPKY